MRMAEGTGIEPVSHFWEPRLSKPVQYRSASLPRNGRPGGSRTHKSPRSERGAFANLTTGRWSARSTSNRHYQAPRAWASASWATRRIVGREGVEPSLYPCFEHGASAAWANGPYLVVGGEREGRTPKRLCSAIFGTAGLAVCVQSLRRFLMSGAKSADCVMSLAMREVGTRGAF